MLVRGAQAQKDGLSLIPLAKKYFNCDCSDAQYERYLAEQIEKLYEKMPRPKYRMTSDGSVLPIKLTAKY